MSEKPEYIAPEAIYDKAVEDGWFKPIDEDTAIDKVGHIWGKSKKVSVDPNYLSTT